MIKPYLQRLLELEKPPYYSPEKVIENFIDPPYKLVIREILKTDRQLFQMVQGSTHNHQTWPGGYLDHIVDGWNRGIVMYAALNATRPYTFALSDALAAFFFHDIEKPWKYFINAEGQLEVKPELVSKTAQHAFKLKKIREYGLILTPKLENAIKYAEGELSDYRSDQRVMGPLAAFCHMMDVDSARNGYDYPLAENDPWPGAQRFRI